MIQPRPNAPLLQGVSQYDVDFVIPRVGIDLPLGIDPFLLYKSRDPTLAHLHNLILRTFNVGVEAIRNNELDKARRLFEFPEVANIGLGYTKKGKRGAGVGRFLTELIIQTLKDSPALLDRGVKHVEEMQLVSVGIGPDRVSDIAGNILKQFLIEYTQKQCKLWSIPMVSSVPLEHVYDLDSLEWNDGYFDLPISPFDGAPILLVPRCIVRTLPWINYDDFMRAELSSYLRAKQVRGYMTQKRNRAVSRRKADKEQVASVARTEIERVDRYISAKEATAADAQPSLTYVDKNEESTECSKLKEKLQRIKPGRLEAAAYQLLVLEILNFLFVPELIDGELEVKTIDGTERRDIIFTNDSDRTFWTYLRTEHSSIFLMFEVKNVERIDNTHLNQTATYLGDRLGYVGFVVTRHLLERAQLKKTFSIYNDSHSRKIILVLADQDLLDMLNMKCQGKDPMRYIQNLYRKFRTEVQ